MDEELKNDKCAHTTDGIIHGAVPLEDVLVWDFSVFCFDIVLIVDISW